jgi:glutamate decarboxylase
MFTSAECHYSIPRAAVVAGIGKNNCINVPTDEVGRMIPAELERLVQESIAEGKTPFMVTATVGTTVPGAFDPMNQIADVAQKYNMWVHADGSYGGSVLFSDKHRHLLDGIHRADSVTWNPHKLMGVPLTCSALLVKEPGSLVSTLAMHAEYLFHEDSGPNIDMGDRSLQCGRRVDALKLWFSWQAMGDEGYAQRIDYLFDLAEQFRALLSGREGFRVIRDQQGTNVCFRFLPKEHRQATGDARNQREQEATIRIREAIMKEGSFMVNYAQLDGAATFRLVMSNTETSLRDLEVLLERIEAL